MAAKQSIFLNRKKEKAVLPTLSETLPGMYMSDEPLNVSDAHISCPGPICVYVYMYVCPQGCVSIHTCMYVCLHALPSVGLGAGLCSPGDLP